MCVTLCWPSSNHSLMPEAPQSASPSVSLSLSFSLPPSLFASVCLSLSSALYLSLPSSPSLCNGISIGQIATGIQYADRLIESLIGCLMSACCQFILRETQRPSRTSNDTPPPAGHVFLFFFFFLVLKAHFTCLHPQRLHVLVLL